MHFYFQKFLKKVYLFFKDKKEVMICLYLLVKNSLLVQITNRQTVLNTYKVSLPQKYG